jgi:hypothetical protein
LILGKNEYKAWLTFDVGEEDMDDQNKLMTLYSKKYNARKVDEMTMYIMAESGQALINEYLFRSKIRFYY